MEALKKIKQHTRRFVYDQINKLGDSFYKGNTTTKGLYKSDYYDDEGNYVPPKTGLWEVQELLYKGENVVGSNQKGAEAILDWYETYAQVFGLDPNILLAQAYRESGFKLWVHPPPPSSAAGISQFLPSTLYERVFEKGKDFFSDEERQRLSINLEIPYNIQAFNVGNETQSQNNLGRRNRRYFHQNIINNTETLIKAQCEYMNFISQRVDGLASAALFGYSRGPFLATKNYAQSIQRAKDHTSTKDYHKEGVNYVYKIFQTLRNDMGYTDIDFNTITDGKQFS